MKLFGIIGWKNSGKTGLTERLVAHFSAQGLRVSTLKRSHHGVNLDPSGTDTARHRAAGAQQVLLASDLRLALLEELPAPLPLEALVARMAPVDLVLAEGWKSGTHPRIETYRGATGQPLIAAQDPSLRAVASDVPLRLDCPVFDLNDTAAIAGFIARELDL